MEHKIPEPVELSHCQLPDLLLNLQNKNISIYIEGRNHEFGARKLI
jgi:hypothetical protein